QDALGECVVEDFTADLVVGGGAMARFSSWADPALTLLNGIGPAGVIQFALDTAGVCSQIAAVASAFPDVACRIFEQDGLVGLGAAVCPHGSLKVGSRALQLRWEAKNEVQQRQDVNYGDLVRISLGPGQK